MLFGDLLTWWMIDTADGAEKNEEEKGKLKSEQRLLKRKSVDLLILLSSHDSDM